MKKRLRYTGVLFVLLFGLTLSVIVLGGSSDFYLKEQLTKPLLSHQVMALCAIALVALLKRLPKYNHLDESLKKHGGRLLIAASFLLFLVHVLVCYHGYFMGNGDDVFYVLNSAVSYGRNYKEGLETRYLELYPNNLTLVFLYGLVVRGLKVIGGLEPGIERIRIFLILIQSMENILCGVLIARMVRKRTGNELSAFIAWLMYLLLIGLSPWYLVPYSDSTILIFPLLLCELCDRNWTVKWIKYVIIGVLGGIVYLIKPQGFIPVISCIILEIARAFREKKGKPIFNAFLVSVFAFLVIFPGFSFIVREMNMDIDPQERVGMTHYLNMGLNNKTDGCFSPEDVAVDRSYKPQSVRDKYCLESAKNRLVQMGPSGLIRHLFRKTLVNYWDGSFSWNLDFDMQWKEEKDAIITPVIREWLSQNSFTRRVSATAATTIWILVLLMSLNPRKGRWEQMELSCIGMWMFNILFEAKGRYVYIFIPVLIVLAAQSLTIRFSPKATDLKDV